MEAERSRLEGEMLQEMIAAGMGESAGARGRAAGKEEEEEEEEEDGDEAPRGGGAGWGTGMAGVAGVVGWLGRMTGKGRVHGGVADSGDSDRAGGESPPAAAGSLVRGGGGVEGGKGQGGAAEDGRGGWSAAQKGSGKQQGRGVVGEYQGAPVGLITRAERGRGAGVAGGFIRQTLACPGCGSVVSSGEREREREGERERERQTDRQRQRQREAETERAGLLGSARWFDYIQACF